MTLPAVPTPRKTVSVGGATIDVRGLTLGEVKELDALGKTDPEATGVTAVAWGCDVTVEEATAWLDATSPQFGAELAEHIMRLSGMTEETGARFPAGVHARNGGGKRVRPGRPSPVSPERDPQHAP